MKQQSKFSQQQQHIEQHSAAQQSRSDVEFASVEDALRFDAENTMVPPEIAERLKQSAANLPPSQRRSWWRNLFGK